MIGVWNGDVIVGGCIMVKGGLVRVLIGGMYMIGIKVVMFMINV